MTKKFKKLILLVIVLISPLILSACGQGDQMATNSDGTDGYPYRSSNIKTYPQRTLNQSKIKYIFKTMESNGDNVNANMSSDSGEPANVINTSELNNYINSISNIKDYREHIKVINKLHYAYIYLTLIKKS